MTNKFKKGDLVEIIGGPLLGRQGFIKHVGVDYMRNWIYTVDVECQLVRMSEDRLRLVEVRSREERMKKLEEMMSELSDVTVLGPGLYPCSHITNVVFNNPATIVFWSDGSKTVVKAAEGEAFDEEKGLAMAISKKVLGNKGNYFNEFKKWLPDEKEVGCMAAEAFTKVSAALRKLQGDESDNECAGNCDACDDFDCKNMPDDIDAIDNEGDEK